MRGALPLVADVLLHDVQGDPAPRFLPDFDKAVLAVKMLGPVVVGGTACPTNWTPKFCSLR